MKTPEQIRDMEFQKSTMGGYKQSDVELFLEEVASQIELLTKQKNEAERKLQEISKKAPEAALSTAGIQNVLVSAQRVADQIAEDAKLEAENTIAAANLKLTEADLKAREVIAEAESKAVLLGETAEVEAAKIIAAAVSESERIIAEAKESIELEQKLYDRMKIEVSDFRKKAAAQCSALVELINQLPGEIPFNMERSKTVLSVDFSNPEQLLKDAVEERLAKERAEATLNAVEHVEEKAEVEIETALETNETPVEEVVAEVKEKEETAEVELVEATEQDEEQIPFVDDVKAEETDAEEAEEESIPFGVTASDEAPQRLKGHISFGFDEDDEDDDDDEPRLFFRRKKK